MKHRTLADIDREAALPQLESVPLEFAAELHDDGLNDPEQILLALEEAGHLTLEVRTTNNVKHLHIHIILGDHS
jgi:hypothetical protein